MSNLELIEVSNITEQSTMDISIKGVFLGTMKYDADHGEYLLDIKQSKVKDLTIDEIVEIQEAMKAADAMFGMGKQLQMF